MHRRFLGVVAATVIAGLGLLTPSALAGTTNPKANITSISCSAAGDCSAVGNYNQAIGFGQGVLLTETNGTWSAGTQAELPANASPDPMEFPAIPGAPVSRIDALLLNYTGLSQVKCSAPGDCTAIGTYLTHGFMGAGVFLTESDGKWQRGVEAQVKGHHGFTPQVVLSALDCVSAGNCTAAGITETATGGAVPVIFTEKNGKWGTGVVPPLPGLLSKFEFSASVPSLACTSTSSCVVVATALNWELRLVPLIFTGSGKGWTTTVARMPANNKVLQGMSFALRGTVLNAVSCPAASQCTITGTYEDSHLQQQPMAITQSGDGWSRAVELTVPSNGASTSGLQNANIDALDCSAPGYCTEVGTYIDGNDNQQGMTLTEADGTWGSAAEVSLPSPYRNTVLGQDVGFGGLSCSSAGNCVATGSYNYGSYLRPRTNLVLTENFGQWSSASNLTLPANQAHIQANFGTGVSCLPLQITPETRASDLAFNSCTIAGGYTDTAANTDAFASSDADGGFSSPSELTLPGLNRAELQNSLISVLTPVDAYLNTVREASGFTYDFTAAERGRVEGTWTANVNGKPAVIGKFNAYAARPGISKVHLALTAAGRNLLKSAKKVRVSATAAFYPASGTKVAGDATFTLLPEPKNPFGSGTFTYSSGSIVVSKRLAEVMAHHHLG